MASPSSHQTPALGQTATPLATLEGGGRGAVEKKESLLGMVSKETENEEEEMAELVEPN